MSEKLRLWRAHGNEHEVCLFFGREFDACVHSVRLTEQALWGHVASEIDLWKTLGHSAADLGIGSNQYNLVMRANFLMEEV